MTLTDLLLIPVQIIGIQTTLTLSLLGLITGLYYLLKTDVVEPKPELQTPPVFPSTKEILGEEENGY